MKKFSTSAKFTLTKTTITRFTKAQQTPGFPNAGGTSVVPTTSIF